MIDRQEYYAFLSKVFANFLELEDIRALKNSELLEIIGRDALEWFNTKSEDELREELNVDFTTLFLMSNQPIESSIIDNKKEVLVGLQNPVTLFYHKSGYEFNLMHTHLQIPDHIAIEFGFMQMLIFNNELLLQEEFLKTHLASWAIPYLLSIKFAAQTPFYRDLCDFAAEFLASDLENFS